MKITIAKAQKGAGLMEVLVALLLLAVGVLGYTALQVRAVDASTEAVHRSQAIFILKGIAESIRANDNAQEDYKTLINSANSDTSTACVNPTAPTCSAQQLATYDVAQAKTNAENFGLSLRMEDCPGTTNSPNKRQCLFAAWSDTDISQNIDACMSTTGIYVAKSSCMMMEVYE